MLRLHQVIDLVQPLRNNLRTDIKSREASKILQGLLLYRRRRKKRKSLERRTAADQDSSRMQKKQNEKKCIRNTFFLEI
jgi:hypothetical protein